MPDLEQFAKRLKQMLPSLEVEATDTGLLLRRGPKEVLLRQDEEIGIFDPDECRSRRKEGRSYLDLRTGSLLVDEPGLLLYLRLGFPTPGRLSPYQCALLAALLERDGGASLEREAARTQVNLIRRLRLDLDLEVSPMNASRFLQSLRKRQILSDAPTPTLDRATAFEALRDDFRLSSVGRPRLYAGDAAILEPQLESTLGPLLARGVAQVLLDETGAWIEPRDYLVESGTLPTVRKLLGGPAPTGYSGPTILVRSTQRLTLALLTLGRPTLQPLLALAEALRSSSPVARQAAGEAWEKRTAAWS